MGGGGGGSGGGGWGCEGVLVHRGGCWEFFLKILNEPKCVVEPNSFWI